MNHRVCSRSNASLGRSNTIHPVPRRGKPPPSPAGEITPAPGARDSQFRVREARSLRGASGGPSACNRRPSFTLRSLCRPIGDLLKPPHLGPVRTSLRPRRQHRQPPIRQQFKQLSVRIPNHRRLLRRCSFDHRSPKLLNVLQHSIQIKHRKRNMR